MFNNALLCIFMYDYRCLHFKKITVSRCCVCYVGRINMIDPQNVVGNISGLRSCRVCLELEIISGIRGT